MTILESSLMAEFVAYLKSNWGGNSRVSQRRRRLRQLVAMVRGVADAAEPALAVRGSSLGRWLQLLRAEALRGQAALDATSNPAAVAGSARKFLAGVRVLFVCSAEVALLADAVQALERLAGPGADLDVFLKVLQLDAAAAATDVHEAPALAPAYCSGGEGSYTMDQVLDQAGDGDGEVEAASHGRAVVGRACRHKRRALAYRRHAVSGPPLAAGPDRSVAAAMAMARVRRRIGRPSLGPRISLQ